VSKKAVVTVYNDIDELSPASMMPYYKAAPGSEPPKDPKAKEPFHARPLKHKKNYVDPIQTDVPLPKGMVRPHNPWVQPQ